MPKKTSEINTVDESYLRSLMSPHNAPSVPTPSVVGTGVRQAAQEVPQPPRLAYYTERFVTPTAGKYRAAAYIDRELHRKITAIVSVSGTREVTVGSYIDNVLQEHFAAYEAEAKQYCQRTVNRIL